MFNLDNLLQLVFFPLWNTLSLLFTYLLLLAVFLLPLLVLKPFFSIDLVYWDRFWIVHPTTGASQKLKYNTMQYNTIKHNTIQYNTRRALCSMRVADTYLGHRAANHSIVTFITNQATNQHLGFTFKEVYKKQSHCRQLWQITWVKATKTSWNFSQIKL